MDMLESIWSKDEVLSYQHLTQKIISNDWDSLKTRQEVGLELLKKKSQFKKGTWGDQLRLLADQVGYNCQELRRYMLFACKFPNFSTWKSNYPTDQPPSWHQIVQDELYEVEDSSHAVTKTIQYDRIVLNLTNDDPRDRFIFYYFPKVCAENNMNESEGTRNAILQWMDSKSEKFKPSLDAKLQKITPPDFQY